MYQILGVERFSPTTFSWDVFAPDVARAAHPGQFIMLRLADGGERIPLTVADFDRERGTVTLVVQVVGKTTQAMVAGYQAGDWFRDFVGPLGEPAHITPDQHVVLVGGGLGVAPIFPQVRAFKQAGCRVTAIVGFRSADLIFWRERFEPWCDDYILCTDDGSAGRAGFVTGALAEVLETDRPDRVVAVGPLPMMRACTETTRPHGVETVVSLNAIMVDGTGMCGSCRVSVGGEVRFACVDGPDFNAHQVDFDELMGRQRRFKRHESAANDDFAHVCNLERTLLQDGKRNYKKFKHVEPHARPMPERPADERARNFLEVNLGYSTVDAMAEAERCIQCKRPTCVSGCPVGIDIPGFIRHLIVRDLDQALATIQASNLFPSVCGRVCPQESQCEAHCILAKKMEPVAIGRLERFVGDHARPAKAAVPTRSATPKRVAVVGSGPAGLACAGDLARAGVEVTVFEALHVVGGVLRYGIPSFRLPRDIIDREVDALRDMGVRFEVNKVVGRTFSVARLRADHDGVFIATGAGYPVFLGLPGESAGQVYSANEFLTRVNLMGGDRFPYEDTPLAMGDRVAVIGAGNTAMDCLRVARRLGATHVHCVYRRTEAEAPARVEELRHAGEEGVQFHFLRSPVEIQTDGDDIVGLRCQVMALGEPDASGRRRPMPVDGEEEVLACDTVVYALGTRANPIVPRATPDLGLNKWGYIEADDGTQATNLPGVFAGGDIVTGGATVILALGAGRRAAKGLLQWMDDGQWPPTLDETAASHPDGRVCPKCQRPTEGDERYICCADQVLRWRCDRCHKVDEGFAMPYGLCASCGGRLVRLDDRLPTPAEQAIREAFELELGNHALYSRGAAHTSEPELKALFERMAAMEAEHVTTLAERYHVPAPSPEQVPDPALIAIYAGLELDVDDGEGLLELALALELRARDHFARRARELTVGSPEWRLYRELEAEESEHVALIQTELARWRGGRGMWLTGAPLYVENAPPRRLPSPLFADPY